FWYEGGLILHSCRPEYSPRGESHHPSRAPVHPSLARHSRSATSGSRAHGRTPRGPGESAEAAMAMSQSSHYTPPRRSSCGEVAHHTRVAAPSATDLKPAGTLRAASTAACISSGDKDL